MKFVIRRLLMAAAIVAVTAGVAQTADAEDVSGAAAAVVIDGDAAEALARREGCLKCHGVTKDKEGPSFTKLAAKFREKSRAEAEKHVLNHLRTGPVVKFSDGEEEDHRIIRSKDESAVTNLIRWILSR